MSKALHAEEAGPFDLAFIDARTRPTFPKSSTGAVRLARKGSLIVVDNVVRRGAILDPANQTPDVLGVRRSADSVERDKRVIVSTIQTVGVKAVTAWRSPWSSPSRRAFRAARWRALCDRSHDPVPAIDLKDGLCVRLERGAMDKATVFNADPAAQRARSKPPGSAGSTSSISTGPSPAGR